MDREHVAAILYSIFLTCLVPTGIALIWYYANWQVALGVFLIVWGGNNTSKNKE